MDKTILLCLLTCACSTNDGSSDAVVTQEESRTPEIVETQEFESRIREIASEFRDWTCLGTDPNWSPELCRGPWAGPLLSESGDEESHGRKLYFLYVKDEAAYRAAATSDQPVGQAFVKESFEPIRVLPEDPTFYEETFEGPADSEDGARWRLGPPRDLFVMYKLDPKTPDTDQGWVYGTCSTTLEVSSAGRVANCVDCHEDASRDRMLGSTRDYFHADR